MTTHADIQRISRQWSLEDHIIEKDYVLGWLLWGIASHPVLSKTWILKGGAAIKKCYVDTHRHSQDLDFTVLPGGPSHPDELIDIFDSIIVRVSQESDIDLDVRPPRFEIRPHGKSCEGRIYYVGPRRNPNPTAAKIDITHAEDLMRPSVLRSILHPYPDSFPDDVQIYWYCLEELFAEKIRALFERVRPGDLYDIIYLFRGSDLNAEPELISEVLVHKCKFKDLPIPKISDIYHSERKKETEKRWIPMLGRAIGLLPSLDNFWRELPTFFAWLNGEDYEIELVPIGKEEAWLPATLDWKRGQNELLEPIRYAAVNRLLINLGYGGQYRFVEPYSLRHTSVGNVLFYAHKAKSRQIRSYRIDRMQSIDVTHQPFEPVFRIEFTPSGRIPVPLTRRRRRIISSWSERRYIVQCAACGKRFSRKRYGTRINPHKREDSKTRCGGRYGYLV